MSQSRKWESTTDLVARAIAMHGTQEKLAEACGVSQSTVSTWLRSIIVPVDAALRIDRATGGAISKTMLRPDRFGDGN